MFNKYIREYDHIVLLAHKKPDGDAIGSLMAMYLVLKDMGKEVDVVMNEYASLFNFLPGISEVKETTDRDYDLAIVLDTSTLDIISNVDVFCLAKESVCIDHHKSNTKFATYNYVVDDAPSTTQILFELFQECDIPITKDIGVCLMAGLITDTGGFRYREVSDKTFDMASYLYRLGVDVSFVYSQTMDMQTKAQFALSKKAISRLELLLSERVAYTYITEEDMISCHATFGDHEGIVDIGRRIEGVEVSILVKEEGDSKRVSLRSNHDVDVSKIARTFSGGGHMNAAAFDTTMELEEIKKLVLEEVEKYL